MNIKIMYRNMDFIFEIKSDFCWFDLDHKESVHKKYKMVINADREVYANLYFDNKKIEGYIIYLDDNSIPDNYPIDNTIYKFKKLPREGYYL